MPRLQRPAPSRRADLLTSALAGAAYVGIAVSHSGPAGPPERRAFRVVNRTGGRLPVLRLPQQLGTPWVLPGLAVTAAATGRRRLALASALAVPVEKACEVSTKKIAGRPRPARASEAPRLRDDAPRDGPGYPSGHAALATCAVALWGHCLAWPVAGAMSVAAATTAYTRVHQGAHYPADAVGGALLGLAVGSGLAAALGVRSGR